MTVAPSARSVLPGLAGPPRAGVYALGDPHPTHQQLRWGEAEALTIATLGGHLERARIGEAATRQWLIESGRKAYAVIASCHGQFDDRDFLRSRMLLAGGESLTLGDALGIDIDLTGLRLLILSACQTAVLDLRGASGEVRSLASGMLQAGATAVMGSLWPVDDRATYLLMVRFAQEWLSVMHDEPPAPALARAQAWLRAATHADLVEWEASALRPAIARTPRAGGQEGLVAVRGRGDRYSMSEAEQLIVGVSRRRMRDSVDEMPYADPIFWAGFQVHGR